MIGGLEGGLGLAETRRWRSGRERGAGSGLVVRPPGRARAERLQASEGLDDEVAPGGGGGGIEPWFLRFRYSRPTMGIRAFRSGSN